MSSEALRLADELPSIDNLKRIAASDSPTAIQNGLVNAIKWIQSLERELTFERAASFRDQIASLESERDQLRAEVERLRAGLLETARMVEDLKKPVSMDNPESPQAARNSLYMSISYFARAIEAEVARRFRDGSVK